MMWEGNTNGRADWTSLPVNAKLTPFPNNNISDYKYKYTYIYKHTHTHTHSFNYMFTVRVRGVERKIKAVAVAEVIIERVKEREGNESKSGRG